MADVMRLNLIIRFYIVILCDMGHFTKYIQNGKLVFIVLKQQ